MFQNLSKKHGLKNKIFDTIRNYLRNTNLHGCRYIVDKKYDTKTSIFWTILFLTNLGFCFYLIYLQLSRYQETAVLNTIVSTGYPLWKNPFPAVIICNNNMVYKSKAEHIIKRLVAKGIEENDAKDFFKTLSTNWFNYINYDDDEIHFDINKTIQIERSIKEISYVGDIDKLMKQVAHPCSKMLRKCYWKGDEKLCTDLFKLVKTTMGYCCAFNYFATINYQNHIKEAVFSGGSGINSGLRVIIDIEPEQYILDDKVLAVNVLVLNGLQFAEFGTRYHTIAAGHSLTLSLDLSIFKGGRDLKYMRDVIRGCWFDNEGHSHWTKIYNHLTCFNECKANYINEICKCVPFFYAITGSERICSFEDFYCLINNNSLFTSLVLTSNPKEDNDYAKSEGLLKQQFCYCLPSCEDMTYDNHKDKSHIKQDNTTCELMVHFNNIAGTLRLRHVNITWDTLLAIIGGLFGLCIGGSVITLFELIFFMLQSFFLKALARNN